MATSLILSTTVVKSFNASEIAYYSGVVAKNSVGVRLLRILLRFADAAGLVRSLSDGRDAEKHARRSSLASDYSPRLADRSRAPPLSSFWPLGGRVRV